MTRLNPTIIGLGNNSCPYGEAGTGDEVIPGYNLFFLLGILSIALIAIIIITMKKQKSELSKFKI